MPEIVVAHNIISPLLFAVAFLHSKGVIHRDIKVLAPVGRPDISHNHPVILVEACAGSRQRCLAPASSYKC